MVIAIAILLAFAGWTGAVWHYASTSAVESYQKKQDAAQAKIEQQAIQLAQEADNKITDMQAAFEAGKEQARVVIQTRVQKGQTYVANTPVFANPVCVIPDDGLHELNSARASVRTAANPGYADATLPGSGAAPGRQDGDPLPAGAEGHGAVGGVHPGSRPADSGGQVPGPGVPSHPKPKPVN